MCSRVCLNVLGKKKIYCICRGSNRDLSTYSSIKLPVSLCRASCELSVLSETTVHRPCNMVLLEYDVYVGSGRWACSKNGDTRRAHWILVKKYVGKYPFGRPWMRWITFRWILRVLLLWSVWLRVMSSGGVLVSPWWGLGSADRFFVQFYSRASRGPLQ